MTPLPFSFFLSRFPPAPSEFQNFSLLFMVSISQLPHFFTESREITANLLSSSSSFPKPPNASQLLGSVFPVKGSPLTRGSLLDYTI